MCSTAENGEALLQSPSRQGDGRLSTGSGGPRAPHNGHTLCSGGLMQTPLHPEGGGGALTKVTQPLRPPGMLRRYGGDVMLELNIERSLHTIGRVPGPIGT